MGRKRAKLIMAVSALAVSIVMLVSASVAWLTLSTNPEIGGMEVRLYTAHTLLVSESRDGSYNQLLDLREKFKYFVPLRPVSTVDGENWFLPAYEAAGPLKAPAEFILDDTLEHANVAGYTQDVSTGEYRDPLRGMELKEAEENGYYVYTDFWMKTEEEGCEVRLSVPGSSELDDWEITQGTYGSYALANYKENEEGTAVLDMRPETALRVGFLVSDEQNRNRFIIYEPNADERSSSDKPLSGENESTGIYVSGYHRGENNYSEDYYIPTHPIGKNNSGVGQLVNIDPNNLIIQKKSSWNQEALQEALRRGQTPNSNQVGEMGRFALSARALLSTIDGTTGMASFTDDNTAIAADTVIIKLKKDVPQKVRMFIWIEGQDVDCWNDVSGGSFHLNLEFGGTTTEE